MDNQDSDKLIRDGDVLIDVYKFDVFLRMTVYSPVSGLIGTLKNLMTGR